MLKLGIEEFYVPCVRKRSTATTVNTKYEYQNTTYVSTNINGYLGSRSTLEQVLEGKTTLKTQYNFYCDDFAMAYGDIVTYESIDYRVISNPQNTVHQNSHIKVIVEKVN